MKEQKESTNRYSKQNKNTKLYLRYSGLAFELFAIIGVGVWGGYKLDSFFDNKYPVIMIIMTFVSTGAALYSLFRKLPKF